MMINKINKNSVRVKRHRRIRYKIFGTNERPRLNVFRSNTNIYAQLIDDDKRHTLVSASSLEKDFGMNGNNKLAAKKVGNLIAKRAVEKGYKKVVFDRSGYIYHGRVKELADGAREGGLEF